MEDFEGFGEFAGGFSIQDMMDDSGLSRSGVMSWIHRGGYLPIRKEGRKDYYADSVLNALLTRREYHKTPETSETLEKVMPANKSLEYETSIAQMEKKIKNLEHQFKQLLVHLGEEAMFS